MSWLSNADAGGKVGADLMVKTMNQMLTWMITQAKVKSRENSSNQANKSNSGRQKIQSTTKKSQNIKWKSNNTEKNPERVGVLA